MNIGPFCLRHPRDSWHGCGPLQVPKAVCVYSEPQPYGHHGAGVGHQPCAEFMFLVTGPSCFPWAFPHLGGFLTEWLQWPVETVASWGSLRLETRTKDMHQTNWMRMVFDENGLRWKPGLVLNEEEEESMEKAHVYQVSHTGESQSEGFWNYAFYKHPSHVCPKGATFSCSFFEGDICLLVYCCLH